VRVYTKYRTSSARKAAASHFQWVMVSLLGAFLAWVWWNNLQRATHLPTSEPGNGVPSIPVLRALRDGSTNFAITPLPQARVATPGLRESPIVGPHTPKNTYELQIALGRRGISAGSLDGAAGSQTRAALRAFQEEERLPATGEADTATKARLLLSSPPDKLYTVTPEDVGRLSPVGTTWLAKSLQDRLDYESILELVAEKGHAHPNLIRMLNPSLDWNKAGLGTVIRIPDVEYPPVPSKAARIRIRLSEKTLDVFDRKTNLLAHFPCSIGRQVEKRPVGKLQVEAIVFNPNYTFNPEIFPESEEARQLGRPLMIPKGPNNPVGTAWIGLNRPGYGIHGTPHPEDVGRTESHGCFRLANWNADYLAEMVEIGTPVLVEP
jgi:lipoprotein-anchoring transpeptidase ErfK/SrfK